MEYFILQRKMDEDLTFIGQEIASVVSTPDQGNSECYSGYINEWTELKLYRTQTGAFACNRITRIVFDEETDIHEASVCYSVDAVIEFFGTDWLAKELYDRAGIEAVEVVA